MPTTTQREAADKLRRLVQRYNTAERYRYLALRDDDTEVAEAKTLEMKRIAQSASNLIDREEMDVDPQQVFVNLTRTSRVPFLDGSSA